MFSGIRIWYRFFVKLILKTLCANVWKLSRKFRKVFLWKQRSVNQKHAQSKDLIEATCSIFENIEKTQKLNVLQRFFFGNFRGKTTKKSRYISLSHLPPTIVFKNTSDLASSRRDDFNEQTYNIWTQKLKKVQLVKVSTCTFVTFSSYKWTFSSLGYFTREWYIYIYICQKIEFLYFDELA